MSFNHARIDVFTTRIASDETRSSKRWAGYALVVASGAVSLPIYVFLVSLLVSVTFSATLYYILAAIGAGLGWILASNLLTARSSEEDDAPTSRRAAQGKRSRLNDQVAVEGEVEVIDPKWLGPISHTVDLDHVSSPKRDV